MNAGRRKFLGLGFACGAGGMFLGGMGAVMTQPAEPKSFYYVTTLPTQQFIVTATGGRYAIIYHDGRCFYLPAYTEV